MTVSIGRAYHKKQHILNIDFKKSLKKMYFENFCLIKKNHDVHFLETSIPIVALVGGRNSYQLDTDKYCINHVRKSQAPFLSFVFDVLKDKHGIDHKVRYT